MNDNVRFDSFEVDVFARPSVPARHQAETPRQVVPDTDQAA